MKSWILLFLSTVAAHAEIRTWTNTLNRTFEAEFLRAHGSDAIFKLASGREFSMPVRDLSPADQAKLSTSPQPIAAASPGNFGRPWPREVRVNGTAGCKVISEDAKTGRYIYESPGYRFICDARVTDDALRNFSVMFETTRAYAKAVPLSLGGGRERNGKLEILLFGEEKDYVKAGGPPGSAGCFAPSSGLVMVPMPSLGLERGGTGFSLNTKKKNDVLIHELVHQLTPQAYFAPGARGWFSEGLAEIMAITPYNWGYFAPDIYGDVTRKYVTGIGAESLPGRRLGKVIQAPKLKSFMLMDYRQFSGENANFNYGMGLLLTHYFLHMEGGGKTYRITQFLKGLQAGHSGEAALTPLLGGSTFERLESDITAAWAKMGLEIRFGN